MSFKFATNDIAKCIVHLDMNKKQHEGSLHLYGNYMYDHLAAHVDEVDLTVNFKALPEWKEQELSVVYATVDNTLAKFNTAAEIIAQHLKQNFAISEESDERFDDERRVFTFGDFRGGLFTLTIYRGQPDVLLSIDGLTTVTHFGARTEVVMYLHGRRELAELDLGNFLRELRVNKQASVCMPETELATFTEGRRRDVRINYMCRVVHAMANGWTIKQLSHTVTKQQAEEMPICACGERCNLVVDFEHDEILCHKECAEHALPVQLSFYVRKRRSQPASPSASPAKMVNIVLAGIVF